MESEVDHSLVEKILNSSAGQALFAKATADLGLPKELLHKDFRETYDSNGEKIGYHFAMQLLRRLDKAGCGRFKVGRRGGETRLIWKTEGLAAVKAAFVKLSKRVEGPGVAPAHTETEFFEFKVPLRRGMEILLVVPVDLTADERHRLATAVSVLPVT